MIQPRTQTQEYWEHDFALTDADIDQLYTHFLDVEKPQSVPDLVRAVMDHRVAEEKAELMRRVKGYEVYQPQHTYAAGTKVVFPLLDFANGEITAVRDGINPQEDSFKVISVNMNGKVREFASELVSTHPANLGEGGIDGLVETIDSEDIYNLYHSLVEPKVEAALHSRDNFLRLGGQWFVTELLADVNVGHLHLAEAVLEMSEGGPLSTAEIVTHLDLEASVEQSAQLFSLNYALLKDERFDEVAPRGRVAWYLSKSVPDLVSAPHERLVYEQIAYDRALLSPQLMLLEREISDEWSDLESAEFVESMKFTLLYPHRILGTAPLNATITNLLPLGQSPRQIFTLRDAETKEDYQVWVIKDGRYIYGLKEWYEKNEILVGSYITISKGEQDDVLMLDYERRRPVREDIRLASVVDGRVQFELQRRAISCGYDDLMVIGTDVTAAIDALFKRTLNNQRSISSLLAMLLPALALLSLQNAVHSKTIYSAINMLRRLPPGPVFAELVRHPAFQPVGDQYWRFDPNRWQKE